MSILLMFLATAADTPDFAVRKRADYVATLTASFHESDTNKDGMINISEAIEAAKKSFHVPVLSADDEARFRATLQSSFDKLDTNKDGQNSLDELLRLPLANFDCLDANHDGLIPQAEAEANIDRCEAAAGVAR